MTARPVIAALVLALAVTGCEQPDDQETGSISRDQVQQTREQLDPAVVALLDSGNAAYGDQDYQAALEYYEQAAEAGEDVAAAWFGIYMAHLALGNTEEAEAAMDRAKDMAPSASLIHPTPGTDTTP